MSRLVQGARLVTPPQAGDSAKSGKSVQSAKMHYLYVLENKAGSHYVGYTSDLAGRIKGHNSGKSRWTWKKGPWRLVYKEGYPTKNEAFLRERQIKSYKGGEAFQKLLTKGTKD